MPGGSTLRSTEERGGTANPESHSRLGLEALKVKSAAGPTRGIRTVPHSNNDMRPDRGGMAPLSFYAHYSRAKPRARDRLGCS
jgi:hypothetical protein